MVEATQSLLPVTPEDKGLVPFIWAMVEDGEIERAEQAAARHRLSSAKGISSSYTTPSLPMQLVPVEPTEAMYLAAFDSDHWGGKQPIRRVVDEIWSAMVRAALTPSALSPEPVQKLHELPRDVGARAIELLREYMEAEEIDDVDARSSELGACRFSVRAFLETVPSALSGDGGEGQSKRIYREFPVYRSQVENDERMKGFPSWIAGRVAILGYREQGFRVCAQPGGKDVGNGAWGDLIVEYADGSLGVRAAHQGAGEP